MPSTYDYLPPPPSACPSLQNQTGGRLFHGRRNSWHHQANEEAAARELVAAQRRRG